MRIYIVSRNTHHQEEWRRMLAADPTREVQCYPGGVDMLMPLAEQFQPDVLVLECEQELHDFSLLATLSLRHPDTTLLLLCASQSPDFLLGAMRAGVREVLLLPLSQDALQQALARVVAKRHAQAAPQHKGKVVAFIPCKGGSGATFLATNLGYYLAAQEKKRVLLLDLNLQFGDAALFVTDRKPLSNLAELTRQIHRLDAAFLSASLLEVLPNFGILAAPDDPVQAMEVTPAHVDTLVNVARQHYDIVVLDLGRALGPVSIKALDLADVVFPVLQITLPFIRDARRLLDVMRSLGYGSHKIRTLVNRYEKGGDIQLADVERTLGLPVYKTLPNSFKAVATSVNQGVPISRLAPNNPVSRTLLELGRALVVEDGGDSGTGWWGSLLQRVQGAVAEGGNLRSRVLRAP